MGQSFLRLHSLTRLAIAPDRASYLFFPVPLLASTAQKRLEKLPTGDGNRRRVFCPGAILGAQWFPSIR